MFNVHFIVNKLRLFKYESSYCRPVVFGVATLVSETVFTAFFAFTLSNFIYFMGTLGRSTEEYFYFIGVQQLTAYIGLATAMFLSALILREIAVREVFLMLLFIQLFLSGFPFQLPDITDYMSDVSKLNPMRWVFEGLMVWYFERVCPSEILNQELSNRYLKPFGFEDFDENDVFGILGRFLLFAVVLFFLFLIPVPNRLYKRKHGDRSDRDSSW